MDKLEERLRSSAKAFREHPVYDSEGGGCYLGVQADEMDEAADEITRLKGEVDRLTMHCANYEATMRVIGESSEGAALAAKQALIDELVEGLEPFAKCAGKFDRFDRDELITDLERNEGVHCKITVRDLRDARAAINAFLAAAEKP